MASRKGAAKIGAKASKTPKKIADAEDAARGERALNEDASPSSVATPKIGHNRGPPLPKSRGEFGFSVPEAGAMIGLSVNPAYAAAKAGEIPTVRIGGLLIVPKALWLKKLGVEAAGKAVA